MDDEILGGASYLRQALEILKGLLPQSENGLPSLISLLIIFGVATLVWSLFNHIIRPLLLFFVRRTQTQWDDAFAESRALHRATLIPAALVFYGGLKGTELFEQPWDDLLERIALALVVLLIARVISAGFTSINIIYTRYDVSLGRPIKGFIQLAKLTTYFIGTIVIVGIMINKSPMALVTGLSAMTAVLMLVFRDTILSLVAGVQLTGANQIQVGDWIEMPQFNADGTVIDLALNTVSVENWDNTISIIPAHNFLNYSFKNWRNVFDKHARRIKTQLFIDMESVRRLTDEDLERLRDIRVIAPYLDERSAEIAAHNQKLIDDGVVPNDVNFRGLTNFGLFRVYVDAYIRDNPHIVPSDSATLLVRAMQSTEYGIPLEVYAFSSTTSFVQYENIKQDIFDHLLTTLPVFGLRSYQAPSGHNMRGIGVSAKDGAEQAQS